MFWNYTSTRKSSGHLGLSALVVVVTACAAESAGINPEDNAVSTDVGSINGATASGGATSVGAFTTGSTSTVSSSDSSTSDTSTSVTSTNDSAVSNTSTAGANGDGAPTLGETSSDSAGGAGNGLSAAGTSNTGGTPDATDLAGTGVMPGLGGMVNSGGASDTGGSVGAGGASNAGASSGGAAGGMSLAAAGASNTDSGGAPGSQGAVEASVGCGKSSGVPMNINVPNAIVTFPDAYDGSTPVPMMFGFHGAGRTNQEFHEVDARTRGSDLEKNFVMVYLKSAGSGWAQSDVSRLDTAYDQLTQDHCIDTNHVFATGHSSGAYFIELMLCGGDQRFAGVALVSGSKVCDSWDAVPGLLIHGTNDSERVGLGDADGHVELGPFVTSNACGMSTTPYAEAMSCNSIYDQAAVNDGCVAYDGCSAPFVFCNHDDQNYSGTNHGWPCFANQTMYTFLNSL